MYLDRGRDGGGYPGFRDNHGPVYLSTWMICAVSYL